MCQSNDLDAAGSWFKSLNELFNRFSGASPPGEPEQSGTAIVAP